MSTAFFSVADARGIEVPAKALSAKGWRIQADGAAFEALEKAGVAVAKTALSAASKADVVVANLPLEGLSEKVASQVASREALVRKLATGAKKRRA